MLATRLGAARLGAAQIRAFEPLPCIADRFAAKRDQTFPDGSSRVPLVREAVADRWGPAEIARADQGHGLREISTSVQAALREHQSGPVRRPPSTLETPRNAQALPPGHRLLITIDVESCQDRVLAGARTSIAREWPCLVVEILPASPFQADEPQRKKAGWIQLALAPPEQLILWPESETGFSQREHLFEAEEAAINLPA